MGHAANVFGRDRGTHGRADRERHRVGGCGQRRPGATEHDIMRAQHAFGSAGQDAGDTLDQGVHRLAEMTAQQRHQALGEIAAGEVVDPAIALGLADDGDDFLSANKTFGNQPVEGREVAGMGHGQSEDVRAHVGSSLLQCTEIA